MKRLIHSTAVLALLIASSSALRALRTEAVAQTGAAAGSSQQAMLTTYCYTCHNTKVKMGGLALQGLDIQAAGADAEIWEKAMRKLRGRLMPPPGSPQPEQKDIDAFVAWMENKLDTNPARPKAGHVGIQRLSRTEYAAAVKALVGVEIVAKDVLPQDVAVDGFDNIASALSVSPTFVEQYVEAARTIAKKAIGDRSLDNVMYPPRRTVARKPCRSDFATAASGSSTTSRSTANTVSRSCFPIKRWVCIRGVSRTKRRWSS